MAGSYTQPFDDERVGQSSGGYRSSTGQSLPGGSYRPFGSSTRNSQKRYHSHPGCTLCSIVSALPNRDSPREQGASSSPTTTTRLDPQYSGTTSTPNSLNLDTTTGETGRGNSVVVDGREVVYWDEEITVMRAIGKERLCAEDCHLIIIVNQHLTNIYDLGPSDIPMLSAIIDTSTRILSSSFGGRVDTEKGKGQDIRVGFVGSIMRDPQSSHAHLHAHAMAGPIDTKLPGSSFYRRNVVFGNLNWWSVEDLRAEIRESTSNNRVKSGYSEKRRAPIDRVPDAGSRVGLPNALDDDPYLDSPPVSASLHPNDAFQLPPDRKGKAPVRPPRLEKDEGTKARMDRVVSTSSIGSIRNGEEDGYVAVDLQDRSATR